MDLRKEVRRILQENSGEIPYKTLLKGNDVDIYGFKTNNPDEYVERAEMTITWRVEFEGRSYGIKSIIVSIDSVAGYITTVFPGEVDEEEVQREFSYTSGDPQWQLTTEKTSTESITPESMGIDFNKKKINIQF